MSKTTYPGDGFEGRCATCPHFGKATCGRVGGVGHAGGQAGGTGATGAPDAYVDPMTDGGDWDDEVDGGHWAGGSYRSGAVFYK